MKIKMIHIGLRFSVILAHSLPGIFFHSLTVYLMTAMMNIRLLYVFPSLNDYAIASVSRFIN